MSLQGRDLLAALLGDAVERTGRGGQAKVARMIGCSPAIVCMALKKKYAGDIERLLDKMQQVFPAVVDCPVFGDIDISICLKEQNKPFGATNSFAARMKRECKQCQHNRTGKGEER